MHSHRWIKRLKGIVGGIIFGIVSLSRVVEHHLIVISISLNDCRSYNRVRMPHIYVVLVMCVELIVILLTCPHGSIVKLVPDFGEHFRKHIIGILVLIRIFLENLLAEIHRLADHAIVQWRVAAREVQLARFVFQHGPLPCWFLVILLLSTDWSFQHWWQKLMEVFVHFYFICDLRFYIK